MLLFLLNELMRTEVESKIFGEDPELYFHVTVGENEVRITIICDIDETIPVLVTKGYGYIFISVKQLLIAENCAKLKYLYYLLRSKYITSLLKD